MLLTGEHNARVHRVVFALLFFLIAVPVAGASSFEMASARGDFSYRGLSGFDSMVVVETISAGSRVSGSEGLIKSIECVDGRSLPTCVRIVKGKAAVELRVLTPITLSLQERGAFSLSIRKADALTNIWISGCGHVGLRGEGTYSADGAAEVDYSPKDGPKTLRLKQERRQDG